MPSLVVLSVDHIVVGVNIVALEDPFENFWLMDRSLLHKVQNLVLHDLAMIDVVVQLHLHLILELATLLEELFVLDWICKLIVVLSDEMHLIIVGP